MLNSIDFISSIVEALCTCHLFIHKLSLCKTKIRFSNGCNWHVFVFCWLLSYLACMSCDLTKALRRTRCSDFLCMCNTSFICKTWYYRLLVQFFFVVHQNVGKYWLRKLKWLFLWFTSFNSLFCLLYTVYDISSFKTRFFF